MGYLRTPVIVVALFILGLSVSLRGQDPLRINEFMAINQDNIDDEDRNEEDWIEIHNAGGNPASLEGWYLTDKADNLAKWEFPAVTLAPDAYLIVFASGKNRRDPAGKLHTNFRLSGAGEYLALVRPDGVTVVSEFAPMYPVQAPDISYGLGPAASQKLLLAPGAPARALIPFNDVLEGPPNADFGVGDAEPEPWSDAPRWWTLPDFDDSTWLAGATGVGYGYPGLIGLDVVAMRNVNGTVYIRVPFVVEDPSAIEALTLRIRFDDGMIAYLNGWEVGRSNAPAPMTETWNSNAPTNRSDSITTDPVDFNIPRFDFLQVGVNVLAVQGLNNGVRSSDLLILPELLARISRGGVLSYRYFPAPTPGMANNAGVETLGPIITDVAHHPQMPKDNEDLWITARIAATFDPAAEAQLHYRVMFDPEVTIPFLDDGGRDDGGRGDGVYGARIPASAFSAGQMVRWYVTASDTGGRTTRFPTFLDPLNSPQYEGTVAADPSLNNPLPVLHRFLQNPGAADTEAGTRGALFYDGEFYDNVLINVHGQSSRGFPKKSYDVDFHPGHNFKWAPAQPRADDINLMTTYPDKAQMRNILAYETYRDADCPYHWVFAVRVQQNGAFWGTAHVMENGDEDWLIRLGLNPQGALYKMYNTFTSPSHATSGAEKKTRRYEDNTDLLALFNGVNLTGEARRRFLYDNVDVSQVVNFLAARIITGDTDCCHKNYYFYRDTGGSNEWQMWPWDVDLTFGRRWINSRTYWDQNLIPNTPLFIGNNNRLPQAIFDTPEMRQMYLRRIRTLMDELLKPPGTPQDQVHYEPRIDELAARIAPDAALDAAKWNSHAWGNGSTAPCCPQSLAEAVEELKSFYLPERRHQLFAGLAPGANEIPGPQPPGTVVFFVAIETDPVGGNQNEGYIQLLNPNPFAVDISGWTVSVGTETRTPLFAFRGGTVIPTGGLLYVAADRVAFRARRSFPTGGQGLFIVGDYAGRLPAETGRFDLVDRQGGTVFSAGTANVSH